MKLNIYNKSGEKLSKKAALNDDVFAVKPNDHCVYLAINSELSAIRQGTHSAKTRAEVRGTGAKPYRQKGTGRARVGSLRNPSRVHGSKAFGPKPHGYEKKVNKKVKVIARKSVLSKKVSEENFMILDEFSMDTSKTREFNTMLDNLKLTGKKVTVLPETVDENLYLSSRNLKNINVVPVRSASTYDLLDCQLILADLASVEALNNILAG